MQCICYCHRQYECISCATEVESNLIAMGFEATSDSVVAHLPDPPSSVKQSSVKSATTHVHARSVNSSPLTSAACKPTTTSPRSDKANTAVERHVQVSVAAAETTQQQSLYQIIRQRSQLKLSTPEEHSEALSHDVVSQKNSDADGTQHPQRESSVKFCLENNAFISASSAEESQCR